jgi:lipopolysaccharide transport system permease protein
MAAMNAKAQSHLSSRPISPLSSVEIVIDARRHGAVLRSLRELWTYREVIWAFTERYVRLKYKQAVLGIAWAALQPLAFLAIFALIFGHMARFSGGGIPYPAFALSALVPWFFVQSAVTFGGNSLVMDSVLIKKVYFPRELPVLGSVLSASVDFLIGFAVLLVVGPLVGLHISAGVLLAVPLWLMLAALAWGVSLPIAALSVFYRDFRYTVPLFLQLWMFASPVAYPLTVVPVKWRSLYLVLNPAASVIDGFRQAMTGGHLDPKPLAISGVMILMILWAGYALFKRLEPGFGDWV